MDSCRNVSVSGGLPTGNLPPEQGGFMAASQLDEFLPGDIKENDGGLEWLSVFLEDCLSGNVIPIPIPIPAPTQTPQSLQPSPPKSPPSQTQLTSLTKQLAFPKVSAKRKRTPTITSPIVDSKSESHMPVETPHLTPDLPLLLHQSHWLADSELLVPLEKSEDRAGEVDAGGEKVDSTVRRCTHCLSHRTPQWRAGPLGPKTLCNACGVRFKSGRLLPEYRPAKSPTFVSYKHSNSHKKVMEMRMTAM